LFSSYSLSRVPRDTSLQAWNAADELLLERIENLDLGRLLLVNDSFGALAIKLSDKKPDWWNDSAMSVEALTENCRKNDVNQPGIFNSKSDSEKYQTIVIHIPKSKKLFQWQLKKCAQSLAENGKIYALGMVKHISKGQVDSMNSMFDSVNPYRAVKKARVVELDKPIDVEDIRATRYNVPELGIYLENLPGCFAENTVDPGGRLFISFFNQLPKVKTAIDLGCGNGLLSIALLMQQPEIKLTCIDENFQALESARLNIGLNLSDSNVSYLHSNSLNLLENTAKTELILCNPPFHQENTLTEEISSNMFKDAHRHLSENGELWVVANRNLPYFPLLKKLFKQVTTVSKSAKFSVYQCIK